MAYILIFLLLLFAPQAYAADVGTVWGMWGDSQTDGRAYGFTCVSSPDCIKAIFNPAASLYKDGDGGMPLSNSATNYEAYAGKAGLSWVHIQESGDQNEAGQQTTADFKTTFHNLMTNVRTDSLNAVISYETAYSFGREAEAYRNWDSYNVALREEVGVLATEGITIVVADVDATIKSLVTALGAREVWYQTDEANPYHYKAVGNLMVAVTVLGSLGYDVDTLNMSGITDITAGYKAAVLAAYHTVYDGAPAASCSDGIQNQNETGIDCGGVCSACSSPVPATAGRRITATGRFHAR